MINRLGHEFIYLIKLAWKTVHEIFLLVSHFVCCQVSYVFEILLDLRGKLTEELVWGCDLLLEVLLSAPDSVKAFGAELMKIVFKAHKVGL